MHREADYKGRGRVVGGGVCGCGELVRRCGEAWALLQATAGSHTGTVVVQITATRARQRIKGGKGVRG